MVNVDSEILTVMFIDVAGYTKMTTTLGREEFDVFHETFDNLSVPVFQQHGGHLVKKIGDAFLVTFKSATDAVLCGVKLQSVFHEYNKQGPKHPIHIRVALHTGEILHRHGDIYGDAVNTTARIEGVAKEGHIVFSESTFFAMNKNEVPFVYLGPARLKGLKYPIKLFRVKGSYEDIIRRRFLAKKKFKRFVKGFILTIIFAILLAVVAYFLITYKTEIMKML